MQTFTINDLVNLHRELSYIPRPSSRVLSAIDNLENRMCSIVETLIDMKPVTSKAGD